MQEADKGNRGGLVARAGGEGSFALGERRSSLRGWMSVRSNIMPERAIHGLGVFPKQIRNVAAENGQFTIGISRRFAFNTI